MECIVRISKLTMEEILVFTMFCMALIAADEIQVRYSVHKTTGSESVTSTCLLQCATRFSSFEATGVRVSSSQCLCEALDMDWALTLPLQMSPGYVYMVKQENTQTFTQLNVQHSEWHLVTLPMTLSGTELNVGFAPIGTVTGVKAGFTFGANDYPLMLSMDFLTLNAEIYALINGAYLYQYGYQSKVQAFTGSVKTQNTITLEVDHTGLTQIYLDGEKIMDFIHHLANVRRSNKFYVSANPNARLTRLEFKKLP